MAKKISKIVRTSIREADLSEANLTRANLRRVNLREVDFSVVDHWRANMNLGKFMKYVEKKEIPPCSPKFKSENQFGHEFIELLEARSKCNGLGMWPIVDQKWTKVLSDWIGDRSVLEIMAGGGWIAKALNGHGIDITASDDFSWEKNQHSNMSLVFPVEKIEAVQAIRSIDADILLASWPPYESDAIVDACNEWGETKPIIYIGEGLGGCTAPDEFFSRFQLLNNSPVIPLVSWYGIHDHVMIGKFNRG